jgi:hypothetical protein
MCNQKKASCGRVVAVCLFGFDVGVGFEYKISIKLGVA